MEDNDERTHGVIYILTSPTGRQYVNVVLRGDRSGYSVTHYKTKKRAYFTSNKLTMEEKKKLAIEFLDQIQQMDDPQPSHKLE